MRRLSSQFTPTQKLVFGFLFVILLGAILLTLPISQRANAFVPFADNLFTATSMVSVTGLTVVSVGEVYSTFGQVICILLMQIGGLGWITVATLIMLTMGEKLSLKEQFLLQDSLNRQSSKKFKQYLMRVYQLTFLVEFIAALLLMIDFIPRYGWAQGVFNSIFVAISAFCNAGFDNIGSTSLQQFVGNPLVNGVVALLIIGGGIGFSVWYELTYYIKLYWRKPKPRKRLWRQLSVHSKLVITTTLFLLLFGTVTTWLSEINNPNTIGQLPFYQQLLASFFQSVSMRTAGFATLDYAQTMPFTNFIYILLMLIGGSPGGTAGGLKVTTVVMLVLLVKSTFKGQSDVTVWHRRIPTRSIKQALTVIAFYFATLLVGFALLLLVNGQLDTFKLWFEAVSAIGTVGVTTGITTSLNELGRLIIMIMMFMGRVGVMTVLLSLMYEKNKDVRYANADILIG